MSDESAKPKGPASYFQSIEKKYGQPIAHWLTILDGMSGKAHMEMVNELKTTHNNGTWPRKCAGGLPSYR